MPRVARDGNFATIMALSPSAVLLVSKEGRIEMANPAAGRIFGYEPATLENQSLAMLVPDRFRPGHSALLELFFVSMRSRQMGHGGALYGLRRDGTEFRLSIGLNAIDVDGVPMVLAAVEDITTRLQADLVEQRSRELERSNAELDEFAHVASHDLKAPLRGIEHLADWIASDVTATASEETRRNLELLKGRVKRLQALLDGLLAYSRVGHSQRPVEDCDVNEIVRDIAATLAPPPGFVIRCETVAGTVRTHRVPLRVVLENLISNAIKHHDRSGGEIAVGMQRDGSLVEFRVSDDGPGILPRFHERIFVIFQTLVRRDERESSGLGLAIVKKKIEGHGGKIRVESNPPVRGSRFVFTWAESPS